MQRNNSIDKNCAKIVSNLWIDRDTNRYERIEIRPGTERQFHYFHRFVRWCLAPPTCTPVRAVVSTPARWCHGPSFPRLSHEIIHSKCNVTVVIGFSLVIGQHLVVPRIEIHGSANGRS